MPDDHEERFRQHEEMIQGLARMLAAQHMMNEEQREMNRDIKAILQQQVEINADVKTTLARVETLLARMIPSTENGREA